jgi:hypothetical protein
MLVVDDAGVGRQEDAGIALRLRYVQVLNRKRERERRKARMLLAATLAPECDRLRSSS